MTREENIKKIQNLIIDARNGVNRYNEIGVALYYAAADVYERAVAAFARIDRNIIRMVGVQEMQS